MAEYPEEYEDISVQQDPKEYAKRFNALPEVRDNGVRMVNASLDKIKNISIIFLVVAIILLGVCYFAFTGVFQPVNNVNVSSIVNATVIDADTHTITPVFNVGIYFNQTTQYINFTMTNYTTNIFPANVTLEQNISEENITE